MIAACLASSCSGEPTAQSGAEPTGEGRGEPRGSESAETQPGPGEDAVALPRVPAKGPAALAGQLDRAVQTLRDDDAAPGDLRRAAEFQQYAIRVLAYASPEFGRAVTGRLTRQAALVIRPGVVAGRELAAMTTPELRLPRWRIIAPPPAKQLLAHYRAAQRRTGVPWNYLAAIHLVETRMGRIRGVSSAGARGPMQFLPSTWAMYGAGGDISNHRDAILAAGRLLKANGAPGDMADALWHYNPSDRYVRAVSEYAHTMARAPWAYRACWHWRVLYSHTRGTYVLPVGYPEVRPALLPER